MIYLRTRQTVSMHILEFVCIMDNIKQMICELKIYILSKYVQKNLKVHYSTARKHEEIL